MVAYESGQYYAHETHEKIVILLLWGRGQRPTYIVDVPQQGRDEKLLNGPTRRRQMLSSGIRTVPTYLLYTAAAGCEYPPGSTYILTDKVSHEENKIQSTI